MKDTVAICGANSINAITDIIHGYYCGKTDRQSLQIRIQDAIDQLSSVRKQLVIEHGELFQPTPEPVESEAALSSTEFRSDILVKAAIDYSMTEAGKVNPAIYNAYRAGASHILKTHVPLIEVEKIIEDAYRVRNQYHKCKEDTKGMGIYYGLDYVADKLRDLIKSLKL